MGSIVFACVSPHPPILVHEVGMGRERSTQKTIDALEMAAGRLAQRRPETAIVISPHGPLRRNAFGILTASACSGTFAQWGAPQVTFSFENDPQAVEVIRAEAAQAGLGAADHAAIPAAIPLTGGSGALCDNPTWRESDSVPTE